MAISGCRRRARRRSKTGLLRELAQYDFTVFGRDNDEPVEIVERLIQIASSK